MTCMIMSCFDVTLFCLSHLHRLYAKQKKFALGSAKFDKVIELMEKEYGTDSAEVMGAYMEYGKVRTS